MTRGGVSVGACAAAPPARRHRAIADAPGIMLLTSRVSIFHKLGRLLGEESNGNGRLAPLVLPPLISDSPSHTPPWLTPSLACTVQVSPAASLRVPRTHTGVPSRRIPFPSGKCPTLAQSSCVDFRTNLGRETSKGLDPLYWVGRLGASSSRTQQVLLLQRTYAEGVANASLNGIVRSTGSCLH